MKERENSDEFSGEKCNKGSEEIFDFRDRRNIGFLGEKSVGEIKIIGGFEEKTAALEPKRTGSCGFQELTLSYLCDNSKLSGFPEKDHSGKNLLTSFEKLTGRYKGKEVIVSEDQNDDNLNMWVERDFLQLNGSRGNSSNKRESENLENEGGAKEKKAKVESLNLSLALPDVSLSLAESNPVPNVDVPSREGVGPSRNDTKMTCSNDFTTASLSFTYSHPFSHNPSCSLARNSTENCDYSMGSRRRDSDRFWNCGEGTNGSVHSRFRPIGDGTVALSNYGGSEGFGMGNCSLQYKDSCNNSFYKTTSSDNLSFFPSELPARPGIEAQSGDSRGRGSENLKELEELSVGRVGKLPAAMKLLREIVSESVPVMAQIIQELTDETVDSVKEYLKTLIASPERKDELAALQKVLEKRSDLGTGSLSKCNKNQLEILVAIKMGLGSFLSSKNRLPTEELVDIFLLARCRNVNCRRVLPVDDCDCRICSSKKGFCSECMCPVCLNFDCASNTCSWVGCDVCSHWCHATCGLQRNLIKPGPRLKGPSGTSEIRFHCLGCGHASDMFGFVKDVFMSCAKVWALATLVKELECARTIFAASEDRKGKEFHLKVAEMLIKLQNKTISPSEACNSIFQFFSYTDGLVELGSSSIPSTEVIDQSSFGKDATFLPLSCSLTPKASLYGMKSSNGRPELMPSDLQQNEVKFSVNCDRIIEDEWSVKPAKKDSIDSLESLVRIKEAEARMFQGKADEARREVDSLRRIVRMKTEKLEEEYSEKLAKLCLQDTEETRRKKLEELKGLENSHCDYYKMKIRMEYEISGLLKRMEATKQQLV